MEVDLHLNDEHPGFDPRSALLEQIEIFEKALDSAIYKNELELRVIHGIGSGKLRSEIHKKLKGLECVYSYSCEWHPSYGMGSTLIVFKF